MAPGLCRRFACIRAQGGVHRILGLTAVLFPAMYSVYARIFVPACLVFVLWGCSTATGPTFVAKREPWRAQTERACLNSGLVQESRFLRSRSSLGGPSVCGALRPFEMSAADRGRVVLKPRALVRCPMVPKIDEWVQRSVVPAARYYFGRPVVEVKVAASYSCRPINHKRGARLSEHGYANALDVSAFILADGRKITVKDGWRGNRAEGAFLRDVHRAACETFTTVLGPNYDRYHHDHFHLDLARRRIRSGYKRVCR